MCVWLVMLSVVFTKPLHPKYLLKTMLTEILLETTKFEGWWRALLPVYFLGVVFGGVGLSVAFYTDWYSLSRISGLIFPVGLPLIALLMLGYSRHISVSRHEVAVYDRFLFWKFNFAAFRPSEFDWIEVRPEAYLQSSSTTYGTSKNSYGYETWLEGPLDICLDLYMPGKILARQTETDLLDCAERARVISKITGCKIKFTQSIVRERFEVLKKNGYL